MSLNPVSTASPHKMIWWDESISRFLQSTFLEKGIHGEDEANRDIFKFYNSEPIKKRLYGYEAHDDPEAARKTLEENPEAFELNIAPDVWLLLKQYSHSDNGFAQNNHFFNLKDQGNTANCYAYASASALEGLWKLNLDVDSIVEVSELINCQPDSKDDDRGGYAEHCLRYVMTYGVDTVPMVNGSPVIEKPRRRRIDGYIKVPQFNIDYLLLAVAQQPVIATMAVGVKFHNVRTFEDVYEGEDPGTKLTNHSVTIDGFRVDKSTGIGVFKILNSFGEDWGVKGYGLVSIDPTRRQGVGNLYSNPMYPIIYENISPLDRLLMRYGNFYSLSHSGLPIPFRHRTLDGLQPHFHPVSFLLLFKCRIFHDEPGRGFEQPLLCVQDLNESMGSVRNYMLETNREMSQEISQYVGSAMTKIRDSNLHFAASMGLLNANVNAMSANVGDLVAMMKEERKAKGLADPPP
ncbi:hypothetical protein RHGRI_028254 [Rhododendron griersonianum]|uniref:Peptidase C1A papain C-terminal domain-containing protein n=1 Tax=Rhododendron griersonianum TaxID=479676 RepID=A0AAV6IKP8_9ERIC|nr:hypothetical protein RHGRI_028254 [Rhododendron griersonianum]